MLYIVGFGPGDEKGMTIEAWQCIDRCELIIGYTLYTGLLQNIFPEKEYRSTGMRGETERVNMAIREAAGGREVALVCSGDAALYGMAGLAYQLTQKEPRPVPIRVVAGVTAAFSASALLGAPLTHDVCFISLSDLLTPWEIIEKRIVCAAQADFEIGFYNPSSKKRAGYLKKACDLLLQYRKPDCVCGYVTNIAREGQAMQVLTLSELRETQVDMFTMVLVGNSQTKNINGKMVTPRGYRIDES